MLFTSLYDVIETPKSIIGKVSHALASYHNTIMFPFNLEIAYLALSYSIQSETQSFFIQHNLIEINEILDTFMQSIVN